MATRYNLVDSAWELTDPNPDIFAMFVEFNKEFFWSELGSVEVKWSKRMTLCAGLCRYSGRLGLCTVVLSEPLLKLRPRKDLVETLLHEMIHAYLFVADGNREHDAHGPKFQSHMHRINQLTGTNITIYHSFHDEVNHYKTHWWKCDGPCQHRPPFFGFVKRSMNRKPGPNDFWFKDHQASCGGNFIKVKEPENTNSKKQKTEKSKAADDANKGQGSHKIDEYFNRIGGGQKLPSSTFTPTAAASNSNNGSISGNNCAGGSTSQSAATSGGKLHSPNNTKENQGKTPAGGSSGSIFKVPAKRGGGSLARGGGTSKFPGNSRGRGGNSSRGGQSKFPGTGGSPINSSRGGFSGNSRGGSFSGNATGGIFGGNSTGGSFSGNATSGSFSGNSTGGSFSGNSTGGSFSGNSTGGSFSGNSTGGSFGGNSSRGSFNGNSNRGGANGNLNRGGARGNSNRGTFRGGSTRGGTAAAGGSRTVTVITLDDDDNNSPRPGLQNQNSNNNNPIRNPPTSSSIYGGSVNKPGGNKQIPEKFVPFSGQGFTLGGGSR